MAMEKGLNIEVPESFYEKPFVRRMLDPSSPTIEVDGEEASVQTVSMDGKLFPTVVPQEQADGSYSLVKLKPKAAYKLAMDTGNFIQFDSDAEADQQSQILSKEAYNLRQAYKNNQNFLSQGGKGLGDVEFRADMESAISDDSLSRLGYELYRRGLVNLTAVPLDSNIRLGTSKGALAGNYSKRGLGSLNLGYEREIRSQNPLTKESMYEKPLAAFAAGETDRKNMARGRGMQELTAGHELRHAAMTYLMNNTDMSKNKLFENFDGDVEEYIMDKIDYSKIAKGKKENNPEFTALPDKFDDDIKIDPRYIGGTERLEVVTDYATQALKDLNVPEYTEQEKPGILKKLFGMEQGGIMMAKTGKLPLPMEEATSAPQGGGPKLANAASKPESLGAPTGGSAPAGSSDPRDAAIKEVAQKMQKRSTPPSAPAPQMTPPPAGLAAPTEEIPMMAKGGMPDDGGMSVMIGLGAPSADYEEAAEGNPPPGATKEEVADDQLVLLSEGELVVPANVVRFHGLGTYEGMRREALMGLQDMETNGQIEYVSGGADKADKVDDDGGIIKANQGTFLGNPTTQGTYIRPPGLYTANPAAKVPQAASSKYVTTPNKSLGMSTQTQTQPLAQNRFFDVVNPGIPVGPYTPVTTASSLYAPNVGSYKNANDGGEDTKDDTPDDTTDETQTPVKEKEIYDGSGGDAEAYGGASTVFGGESVNGLIQGGKNYEIGYTSSSATPGMSSINMISNLMNLDQVEITDPITGQKATMSKAKYDAMKEDRTNPANVDYIDSLMDLQAGIDYNRTRATDIAPLQTGLAVAAENFGFGKAPGTSTFDQNEYARSLADDLGIDYVGQSMAEVMMQGNMTATKTSLGQPLSPVFTQDAQGNLVPDTRYGTEQVNAKGLAAPEVAAGAGQFSGVPAQPVAVNSFTGPYTEPTLGLAAPASTIDPVTGLVSVSPSVTAGKQSVPGIANTTGTVMTVIDPATGAVSSQPQPQMSTMNTAAMTPAQRSTASEIVDRQMQAAGLAPVTSTEVGISTSPTATQGVSQLGDYSQGIPTSPTATQGISQIGNYGTASGFNSPTGMVDDFGNKPGTPTSSGTQVAGTDVPSSTTAGTGTVSGFAGVDDIGNRGTDTTSAGYTRGPSTAGMEPAQAAAQKSENKASADEAAQEQTGNPNASAVTDSHGNAVTSGGGVVTSGTNEDNEKGGGQGGGGCVIATHAVANNGFSNDTKREAVRWCVKNLHKRWYGEAVRRGYRYHGIKAIEAGRAHNHYEEFKDYIDFATGKKRSLTNLGTFVYRTAQFFITGLFLK